MNLTSIMGIGIAVWGLIFAYAFAMVMLWLCYGS